MNIINNILLKVLKVLYGYPKKKKRNGPSGSKYQILSLYKNTKL